MLFDHGDDVRASGAHMVLPGASAIALTSGSAPDGRTSTRPLPSRCGSRPLTPAASMSP